MASLPSKITNNVLQDIMNHLLHRKLLHRLNWQVQNDTEFSFIITTQWASIPWNYKKSDYIGIDETYQNLIETQSSQSILLELNSPASNKTSFIFNCVSGYSTSMMYNSVVNPNAGKLPQPYTLLCANTIASHENDSFIIRTILPCRFMTSINPGIVSNKKETNDSIKITYVYYGPYTLDNLLHNLWPLTNNLAENFSLAAFRMASTVSLNKIHKTVNYIKTNILKDPRVITHIDTLEELLPTIIDLPLETQFTILHDRILETCGTTTEAKHLEKFTREALLPNFKHEVILHKKRTAREFIEQQLHNRGLAILSNIYYAHRYNTNK